MVLPARARLVFLTCFVLLAVPDPAWGDVTEQTKLLAPSGAPGDYFGNSVAISGDTLVVGRVEMGREYLGAAYVFVRNGSSWTLQATLVASDGEPGDVFGFSVALEGDSLLVGAPNDDAGDWPWPKLDAGSVYVFVRNGSTWSEQIKLVASNGAAEDGFGSSVALSGDTAVIGATGTDTATAHENGSAYIFVRNGSTWTEQAELLASDGMSTDMLGISVSISGNTAVAGALRGGSASGLEEGAAYVFLRNGLSWSEQAKLLASDGHIYAQFGSAVSISGDSIAVGAYGHDGYRGAVYIFLRSGSSWPQQAKLFATDGAYGDSFGTSVAMSGDTLVVGSREDDTSIGWSTGSAYVFLRRNSIWSERLLLLASDGRYEDNFGFSVAISGSAVIVGANRCDSAAGADVGAAYVFSLDGVTVLPTTGLLTTESGGTAWFDVVLNTSPTGDVVIDLAVTDPDEGTVSPARLTFTPDDWWTAQTVTLTGVDDLMDDEGQPYGVTLTMNTMLTEDAVYDGIDPGNVSAVNLPFEGNFYTVPPCRVLDTRLPDQGPPPTSGVARLVGIHEACEVPATARAVALNVTVVDPVGANGELTLYPGDLPAPAFSAFSFRGGRNRAFHTIVLLETGGAGTVTASLVTDTGGTAHLVLDVSGYFE